jgi:hypothetical protein
LRIKRCRRGHRGDRTGANLEEAATTRLGGCCGHFVVVRELMISQLGVRKRGHENHRRWEDEYLRYTLGYARREVNSMRESKQPWEGTNSPAVTNPPDR